MQQIKNWLNGKQNFIIGRAIYRAIISSSDELIQLLDKGFTAYSHQKLVTAFQEYLDPSAKPELTREQKLDIYYREEEPTTLELTSLVPSTNTPVVDPFVLNAINLEWQIPYKKMQHLIARLDIYADSNTTEAKHERKELAGQILELEQIVNSIWAKKDEYQKTGILQSAVVDELIIPTDPIELAELINRTKKGIRNNKTRMQQNPDKPIYAEKYQLYKMQYFKVTGKPYQDKV